MAQNSRQLAHESDNHMINHDRSYRSVLLKTEGLAEVLVFVSFFKICVLVSTECFILKGNWMLFVILALDFLSARC